MNVLLDTSFFGGTGGIEKLVKELIFQKKDFIKIDVFISSGINNEPNFYFENVEFVELTNINFQKYDLYLKIGTNYNYNFLNLFKKDCVKVLTPAGYIHNTEILKFFDFIWEESPDSHPLLNTLNKEKRIVICPPTSLSFERPTINSIVDNITKDFFVTIANDYDVNIKGIDLIYKFASISDIDLVWFCSDTKSSNTNLLHTNKKPKNLKIARNIPKNLMYDTLEKSSAYISFSRSEGFGNAIAEAMMLKKPIFSQKVGVVKYNTDLFNIYEQNKLQDISLKNIKEIDYSSITRNFNLFWDIFLSKVIKK